MIIGEIGGVLLLAAFLNTSKRGSVDGTPCADSEPLAVFVRAAYSGDIDGVETRAGGIGGGPNLCGGTVGGREDIGGRPCSWIVEGVGVDKIGFKLTTLAET